MLYSILHFSINISNKSLYICVFSIIFRLASFDASVYVLYPPLNESMYGGSKYKNAFSFSLYIYLILFYNLHLVL